MEYQDIVYLALLIFSILFGHFFKQIEDLQQRKRIGTIIGILIIFIVSGVHILHNLIFFLINAIIILHCNKRQCHIISFVFSFTYLMFFRTTEYFGIPYPPSHTNMVQMMLTLRMTSVAFDLNKLYTDKLKNNQGGDFSDDEKAMIEYDDFSVDFVELFHYSFNYIGVLAGPFIKYRTFRDYYIKPFSKYAAYKDVMLRKLKLLPIFAIGYLIVSHYVSFSYIKSEEFFTKHSVVFRLMYCIPLFFVFRMRLFIAFVLCECSCIIAGFGAYPIITEPKSGCGPTKNFQILQMSTTEKQLVNTQMNFHTVDAVDVWGTEFAPTFKEGMRSWNTAVQYWLATCIYKRFPYKQYRALATMIISSAWHGIYIGHYICLGCAPFVLPIDDVWNKILLKGKSGTLLYINGWIMLFISRFYFAYLGMAFYYLSVEWVLYYYNSIYHLGVIIGLVMYFGGLQILKFTAPPREPKKVK